MKKYLIFDPELIFDSKEEAREVATSKALYSGKKLMIIKMPELLYEDVMEFLKTEK